MVKSQWQSGCPFYLGTDHICVPTKVSWKFLSTWQTTHYLRLPRELKKFMKILVVEYASCMHNVVLCLKNSLRVFFNVETKLQTLRRELNETRNTNFFNNTKPRKDKTSHCVEQVT